MLGQVIDRLQTTEGRIGNIIRIETQRAMEIKIVSRLGYTIVSEDNAASTIRADFNAEHASISFLRNAGRHLTVTVVM
jgi:hypothetical protein